MNTANNKKQLLQTSVFIGIVVLLVLILVTLIGLILLRPNLFANNDSTTAATEDHTTEPSYTEETRLAPNPFGANDFTLENGYLQCNTDTAVFGIDVSGYQGVIDWQQVKDAGVEFAIIRVAGRGYGQKGVLYDDGYAQANYEGAKAAGIQVGAYFFSQAITPAEAVEEANYILDYTKDWELDFPIVYDWEYISEDARTANVDSETLTACTAAFCHTVENAGHEAMIYFNPHQAHKKFDLEALTDYGFWLALYATQMDYPYKVDMWQYSESGTIPGINGKVDLNLYFPYDNA